MTGHEKTQPQTLASRQFTLEVNGEELQFIRDAIGDAKIRRFASGDSCNLFMQLSKLLPRDSAAPKLGVR